MGDKLFLELGKADFFPELSDIDWLCAFVFHVECEATRYVHEMYTNMKDFKSKLTLFSRQISSNLFTHFFTLTLKDAPHTKRYSTSVDTLHRKFSFWQKLRRHFHLVSCPLPMDSERAPQGMQLELIDWTSACLHLSGDVQHFPSSSLKLDVLCFTKQNQVFQTFDRWRKLACWKTQGMGFLLFKGFLWSL